MTDRDYPVFILGHPRSGTTFMQQLLLDFGLNVTNEFRINRNVLNALKAIQAYVHEHGANEWRCIPDTQERVTRAMYDIMYSISHPDIYRRKDEGGRFANKTPGMEDRLPLLEELFGSRVKYVYCLRNGYDVILSALSTRYGIISKKATNEEMPEYGTKDVTDVLIRWKNSVARYEKFLDAAADRIHLFQVDRFEIPDQRKEQLDELLGYLELDVPKKKVNEAARLWAPVNNRPKLDYQPLPEKYASMLTRDAEFCAIQERYGYSV